MKRLIAVLLTVVLTVGFADGLQAQAKKKATASQAAKKGAVAKKKTPAAPVVKTVELPYNSNDCLFAIPLELDKPYGPTTAPDGGGRMQEVVADKAHPNLFEREHNSVWYKIKVPYNGNLEISVVQANQWDDYDFLVYRNTGVYFSNQVIQNKVMPVAVNLGMVDSNGLAAAALQQNAKGAKKGQAGAKQGGAAKAQSAGAKTAAADLPAFPAYDVPALPAPTIGMTADATDRMLTKQQFGGMIKSIPVRMGEEYYIVLDCTSNNPQGHTITVSVQADAYEPLVLFYDKKARRYVDVDLMILERGEGVERTLVQQNAFRGGKVKFVPGFNYTLYAKKEGYFSVYREFNSRNLMLQDTVMLYQMERTERGSTFQLKNLYFDVEEPKLIGNYDSVLMDYVGLMLNHPDVTFLVKGYVNSYGVNVEADMLTSLDRAKAVKEYFINHGIAANRITTAGMTKNEIKRAAAAALDKGGVFSGITIEIIITGKLGDR